MEQQVCFIEPNSTPADRVLEAIDCLPNRKENVINNSGYNFHRWTIMDYSRAYRSRETTPLLVKHFVMEVNSKVMCLSNHLCFWYSLKLWVWKCCSQVAKRFLAAVKESSEPHLNMSFFINYDSEDILRQAEESTLRHERGSLLLLWFTFSILKIYLMKGFVSEWVFIYRNLFSGFIDHSNLDHHLCK